MEHICVKKSLVIEKLGCQMSQRIVEKEEMDGEISFVHGVVGVVNFGNVLFLVVIKERKAVAKMPTGDQVYRVAGVEFIPFDFKNKKTPAHISSEIGRYTREIKRMLENDGFYYSYGCDLSQSQQRQAQT